MIVLYCDDFPLSYADKPGQHSLAWALAYLALEMQTSEKAESFISRVAYLDNGKPVVCAESAPSDTEPFRPADDLWVSVSHCKTCVAAAAASKPVGVDCERRFPWKDALAKRVCTEYEMSVLSGLPENEREAGLGKIWSRKESYLKMTGLGIRTDLRKLETVADGEAAGSVFCEKQNERFTLCSCGEKIPAQVLKIPFLKICEMEHFKNKM